MVKQGQKIQAAFGPAATPRPHGPAPVQAKIKVKGGATYAAMVDLPALVQGAEALRPAVESADTYLAQSASDVTSRGQGKQAPLLTPHRHLIGEHHEASKFEQALSRWGWGADKMVEEFHESADVSDRITEENRNLRSVGLIDNPLHLAKPLENLHAKVLQTLSVLRFVLRLLHMYCDRMGDAAGQIAGDKDVTANKKAFKQDAASLEEKRELLLSQWNDGIKLHLPSYKATCTERLKTARGLGSAGPQLLHDMATTMTGKWDLLASNIEVLSNKPYGILDSWAETAAALRKRRDNADDYIKNGIDVWADGLVALVKAEAASTAGDNRHDALLTKGWSDAKSSSSAVEALYAIGPMRELFMAQKINANLGKPGLVKIGEKHVENLAGKIADGKYHKTYDDFDADTRK